MSRHHVPDLAACYLAEGYFILELLGLRPGFFPVLAAAFLAENAHDDQNGRRGYDRPFGPRGRPPENGQEKNDRCQKEPAKTEFHVIPSSLIGLTKFIKQVW